MIDPLIQRDDDADGSSQRVQTAVAKQSLVSYVFLGLLLYPFLQGAAQGAAAFAYHRFVPKVSVDFRRSALLGGAFLLLGSVVLLSTPTPHRHERER